VFVSGESRPSASWTCVPTPSSPSTRTSMSAGDRLALGGRSVYAVVRGVNGCGLISVPSRSLTVLLPPPLRSFRYVSDFDENGVLYYLGTGGGTRPWINPHDSGDVICCWSSVNGGTVSRFVGRVAQFSNTKNTAWSWMMVDLGEGRSLTPNYYTLRHDSNNSHYLRHWRLEGRVCGGGPSDGTWVALRTHTGDVSLNGYGASASWSVEGARESYRCFRVIQTGLNSINNHYLMCSGVELYGDLMER